jgi:predicted nucleotidyltransferase
MKFRQPNQMLNDQLLVKHLAGSKSYGTNIETSDTDIRGIFCADEIYVRSPWLSCNEITINEEQDTKYYELTKFMTLVVEQNPNILESLWVDDQDILTTSEGYKHLRNNRELLLSSKCAFTFSGYAHSQLTRIKNHGKWINNPQQVEPPRQINYVSLIQNFTQDKVLKITPDLLQHLNVDHRLISYGNNIFGVYSAPTYTIYDQNYRLNTLFAGDRSALGVPLFIVKFNEDIYDQDKKDHTNYWTWKNNRNQVRSELEQKFGYDTKHALHLIRLMTMCKEILTDHVVNVRRPDAKHLLEIREGKYTYDEIIELADKLESDVKSLYSTTTLRKSVCTTIAARVLIETQDIMWRR